MTQTVTVYRQPQESDTPTRSIRTGTLLWRYAYARSEECRAAGEPGQDYVSLKVAPPTFVFALCDGVSQSFFGDLAARLLGDSLVDWLWQSFSEDLDAHRFSRDLAEHLSTLVHPATEQVQAFRLPSDLPRLVEDVLREKQTLGSESTFVGGRIDLPSSAIPDGRLLVAWMGDSRLRLWGPSEERTREFGETFRTTERWSSVAGPTQGTPHVFIAPLQTRAGIPLVTRVMAYSDGLAVLDGVVDILSDAEVDRIVESTRTEPTSDDVAFVDCTWAPAVVQEQSRDRRVRRSTRSRALAAITLIGLSASLLLIAVLLICAWSLSH